MKLYIKWIAEKKANLVLLPASMIKEFEIIPRRMMLKIGCWRREIEVKISNDIPENTIGLSRAIKFPFDLPDHLPYEMQIKDRELHIGPVIAFLTFTEKQDMTFERLNEYKNYLKTYSNLQGLIYICAVKGINLNKKTIEGYYLDPGTQENENPWKYGVFPYPDVLYRKTDVKKNIYNKLIATLGENIFNTYLFDKWELWQWLSPYLQLNQHLPYTDPFKNIKSLDEMLSKYDSIYLKPIKNQEYKEKYKVDKTSDGYCIHDESAAETYFKDKDKAAEFLHSMMNKETYLMQQAVPVKKYEDRSLDFRVILQKDSSKHWDCSGIIACFGNKEGITANFDQSGMALSGQEALRKIFHMKEKEVFLKEQEIINLCITAGKTLDKCGGHYADLAIHIIIDDNLKVWLIDINPLYDHQLPLYSINDRLMYLKVVSTPFEYAKALAGFGACREK